MPTSWYPSTRTKMLPSKSTSEASQGRVLRDLVEERREDARPFLERRPVRAGAIDDDRRQREDQARHLDSDVRGVVRTDGERGVLRREPDAPEAEAHFVWRQVAQHERAVLAREPRLAVR
jgi:hypothetical protein